MSYFRRSKLNFLIFWGFLLYLFFFIKCWGIDIKELESKSEYEIYNIAWDYFKSRNDQEAFKVVKYLLENRNPRNKQALYILIEILVRNINNFPEDKKKDIYYQVVDKANYIIENIDFYDYRAYYYKGWAFYNLGDLATAERNLKKSLEYYSDYLPSLYYLSRVYLDRNDLENAQKVIDRILKIEPFNISFRKLYFELLVKLNKFDEAISYYNSYLSDTNDKELYYLLSLSYYNKSDFKKALEIIEKSLNLDPNNLNYLKLKVKILFKLKDYKNAEEIIKNYFSDTTDEEIKNIYSNIKAEKSKKMYFVLIILLGIILLGVASYFIYQESKKSKYKKYIQDLKRNYIEKVSKEAENLELLCNFAYDYFSRTLLNTSKISIYLADSKKDNTFYNYINNISDELPQTVYVYTKYGTWLSEGGNKPYTIYQIQEDNIMYEYFGGKNLINFKKEGVRFIIPAVARGIPQALILIGVKTEQEEEQIFNLFKDNKETVSEIVEEFANDVMSTRFKEVAVLDELTRLYNRRYMFQKLEEELQKANQTKSKLSLILCDIDNFKKFNDTYGHQVGDEVLRVVAKVFKESSRQDFDIPFRYGGEEIGLILPNTDSKKAFEIAERIRNMVSSKRFEGVPTIITISIGISCYPEHAGDIESLIKEADEALYYSKKTGKNKTTIAGVKVLLTQDSSSQESKGDGESKDQVILVNKDSKDNQNIQNIDKEFKLPSFCYSYEEFMAYYNNLKNTVSNVKLISIKSNRNNYEKILYDIHFNLLLTESVTAKLISQDEVEIKVVLVERTDKEIQDFISLIENKFEIKIS